MNFLTTPVLKVTTWVKRHPGATILIVLLLLVVPSLWYVMGKVVEKGVDLAKRFLGIEMAEKIAAGATRFMNWIGQKPERIYYVLAVVMLFNPLLGAFLLAWAFMDKFKSTPLTVVPSPAPNPATEERPAEISPIPEVPGLGDWLGDYWPIPTFGGYNDSFSA